jgi:hypothetical protein
MPKAAEPWSLTSLREKLIKISAKVVSHGQHLQQRIRSDKDLAGEGSPKGFGLPIGSPGMTRDLCRPVSLTWPIGSGAPEFSRHK